jgi:hypothetical protein
LAHAKWAAILLPGGEVFFQEGEETLEGTNTAGRCEAALALVDQLRAEGYEQVQIFASGTADHPGQVMLSAKLIHDWMQARGVKVNFSPEDKAWDTGGNVAVFRDLLRQFGWWPKYRRPRADIYVVSQEIHTRRIQVLFGRRHWVIISRRPDSEVLDSAKERLQKIYLLLTWVPFSEYGMSWYAKQTRLAARRAAES